MKVSLILPVYNVEKYIGDCLKSIMNQTYTDFECLIVDDCGSDNSIEVAKSLISEYKGTATFEIIESDKNGGVSVARNKGIRKATGEYLMFVDTDDKLFPNALELLVAKVRKYPDVDIVQGSIKCDIRANYWNIAGRFPEYSCDSDWIREQMLLWHIPLSVWGMICKRTKVISNNLFFMEGFIHEDIAWLFRFQKHVSTIAFVDDFCYYYRTDNDSSVMKTIGRDKTHSALSYLEFYKDASLMAETLMEKRCILDILSPMNFALLRKKSKSKDLIKDKVDSIISLFEKSSVDNVFLFQLKMFRLPSFMINNCLFYKFYFLWKKKNDLI